ncbi:unnamed protein product, partial [Rotaria sordida]
MTHKHSLSPLSLSSIRSTTTISESISIISQKTSSGNPYNMSYLLKRMRGDRNSKITNESSAHAIQQQSIPHEHIIHEQKPLLNNIIALKDTHKQRQQTIINTPIHKRNKSSQFHFDRLKQKNNILVIDPFNKQSYIRRRKPFKRFF